VKTLSGVQLQAAFRVSWNFWNQEIIRLFNERLQVFWRNWQVGLEHMLKWSQGKARRLLYRDFCCLMLIQFAQLRSEHSTGSLMVQQRLAWKCFEHPAQSQPWRR